MYSFSSKVVPVENCKGAHTRASVLKCTSFNRKLGINYNQGTS